MTDYMFTADGEDENDDSRFREVGRVGKMPIRAQYEYERVRSWAARAFQALRSEGAATDTELASTIDLDAIARESDTYDPRQYHRRALRENTDRDSDEQARQTAKERRAQDRKALFYYHRGPVLATHDDVAWRGTWDVALADAPADGDAVRDIAESFDLPPTPRKAIISMFDVTREIAERQDRGASTYELLTTSRVPNLPQSDLDEAARFLAEEVPGITPPERCEYISWADAPASWVYLPAQDTDATGGEEVTHADV